MRISAQKELIRREIKLLLKAQSPEERSEQSRLIKQRLFETEWFLRAHHVMFYVSTNIEVETSLMIEAALKSRKVVSLPCIDSGEKSLFAAIINDRLRDLEKGPFGIWQPKKECCKPVSPAVIDIIVVPAIAYTERGCRLGRGEGYYDRFLEKFPPTTKKIGLAFSFQIRNELPMAPHDQAVDMVITP